MRGHNAMGFVTKAKMQDFRWRSDYSAIFMVWCAGYLGQHDLVAFLKKAKTHLAQDSGRMSRRSIPESFIILLDNVLAPDEEPEIVKSQWVRSESQLEEIFAEAGLIVHSRSDREPMPANFHDVSVWSLW